MYQRSSIAPSQITPESLYRARRRQLLASAAFAAGAVTMRSAIGQSESSPSSALGPIAKSPFSLTSEPPSSMQDAISKTRFRELEDDIAGNSASYVTRPWSLTVEGEVLKPQVFDIDRLLKMAPLEERIYRMRCTEGWSLVIPYVGYPLSELIRRVEPTGNAKYVAFTCIHDPNNLRGQRDINYISWPYVEGLRLDEAMHPLTIIALGMYGQLLPKANGAPLSIKVPWKYGIKSPKAVVNMRFMATQPTTVWVKHYPKFHSFWSNVNPDVSSGSGRQANERRVGDFWRRPTLPFNGYADQVAGLYSGMDPAKLY